MVCYQKFINVLGLNLFIIIHAYMMPKVKFKGNLNYLNLLFPMHIDMSITCCALEVSLSWPYHACNAFVVIIDCV